MVYYIRPIYHYWLLSSALSQNHSQQSPISEAMALLLGQGPEGPPPGPQGQPLQSRLGWNHGDLIMENLWNDLPRSWFLYEDMCCVFSESTMVVLEWFYHQELVMNDWDLKQQTSGFHQRRWGLNSHNVPTFLVQRDGFQTPKPSLKPLYWAQHMAPPSRWISTAVLPNVLCQTWKTLVEKKTSLLTVDIVGVSSTKPSYSCGSKTNLAILACVDAWRKPRVLLDVTPQCTLSPWHLTLWPPGARNGEHGSTEGAPD